MPIFRPGLGDDPERKIIREGGYLEYRFGPLGTTEIVTIEVAPDQRRKGIGTSMVNELIQIPGVEIIYGFTDVANSRAMRFYHKLGCTLTPLRDYYGIGRDAYIFIKNLDKKPV